MENKNEHRDTETQRHKTQERKHVTHSRRSNQNFNGINKSLETAIAIGT